MPLTFPPIMTPAWYRTAEQALHQDRVDIDRLWLVIPQVPDPQAGIPHTGPLSPTSFWVPPSSISSDSSVPPSSEGSEEGSGESSEGSSGSSGGSTPCNAHSCIFEWHEVGGWDLFLDDCDVGCQCADPDVCLLGYPAFEGEQVACNCESA